MEEARSVFTGCSKPFLPAGGFPGVAKARLLVLTGLISSKEGKMDLRSVQRQARTRWPKPPPRQRCRQAHPRSLRPGPAKCAQF